MKLIGTLILGSIVVLGGLALSGCNKDPDTVGVDAPLVKDAPPPPPRPNKPSISPMAGGAMKPPPKAGSSPP
jgi:hypothetical protein